MFKLGTLICDQLGVHVFQCHREGDKWAWPENDTPAVEFITKDTRHSSGNVVALVMDLSAEITDERIIKSLGQECSIYHITIEEPNRNFVRSTKTQAEFVKVFRGMMEKIKNDHPTADRICVFPAMPQSLAIRAGMDYMPKADLPITIYEQVSTDIGFVETITIGGEQ